MIVKLNMQEAEWKSGVREIHAGALACALGAVHPEDTAFPGGKETVFCQVQRGRAAPGRLCQQNVRLRHGKAERLDERKGHPDVYKRQVKAMYETAKGIPFLKYFMDKAEMDRFTANAEEDGSRLVAWAERGV